MNSRLAVLAAVAAAALLLGGVCGKKLYPPEFISVSSEVYSGDSAWVRLATSGRGYDSVRYVVDWDDGTTDTTVPFWLLDTATTWHVWTAPDTADIKAAVYALDDPQSIIWAVQESVVVAPGGSHAPVVDSVFYPPVARRGETTWFFIYAHDPDGDSIRATVAWGDSTDTATVTPFFPSPSGILVLHVFPRVETAEVVVSVQDKNGSTSLPETIYVPVGYVGVVSRYGSSGQVDGALLPNGNIIVSGRHAMYCVAGNPAGPLDPLAPWPKWQHDLYNTGYVGGGR